MSKTVQRVAGMVVVVCAVLVTSGCASSSRVSDTQVSAAVASSNSAVRRAEQAGAPNYAPLEMRRARSKLEQAESAARRGEGLQARRLAQQAEVDAELAESKALSGKAQEAVRQLQESIRVLREEIERNRQQ